LAFQDSSVNPLLQPLVLVVSNSALVVFEKQAKIVPVVVVCGTGTAAALAASAPPAARAAAVAPAMTIPARPALLGLDLGIVPSVRSERAAA
jgi:hypothetical protein